MAVFRTLLKAAAAVAFIVVVGLGGLAVYRWTKNDKDVTAADVRPTPELVARGEYLARAADCVACHTVPGGKPYAGGVPFKLPFGVIHSTNITADEKTGIGAWSDDDFVRALHHGIAKDGTHLYPAFPYTSYTGMSRDDAVAIKAYLFSLEKVPAPEKPNELRFPFDQRWTLAFWNLAFLDARRFKDDPARAPAVNRGDYLANALGHCGECHTPRNVGFALDQSKRFAGAEIQGWRAYNITSDKTFGLGAWSDEELAAYFAEGHAKSRGAASGPMAEVIAFSTRYYTKDDNAALVAYLRTVPPRPGLAGSEVAPKPQSVIQSTAFTPPANEAHGTLGRRIFEGACASCHGWDGSGLQTDHAGLVGLRSVSDPDGRNLVKVMLEGADLRDVHAGAWMPSFAAYSDDELAAVSNYVIEHFGGKKGKVTADAVAKARHE